MSLLLYAVVIKLLTSETHKNTANYNYYTGKELCCVTWHVTGTVAHHCQPSSHFPFQTEQRACHRKGERGKSTEPSRAAAAAAVANTRKVIKNLTTSEWESEREGEKVLQDN